MKGKNDEDVEGLGKGLSNTLILDPIADDM